MREKGRAHELAISLTLAVVVCAALVIRAWANRPNVVVEHNVIVWRQLPDGDWVMSSDEEPDLVFRPCVDDMKAGIDVNGMLKLAAGPPPYIADRATWEERGTCKSLLRPEWQFEFKNKHNNYTYRRIDDARR